MQAAPKTNSTPQYIMAKTQQDMSHFVKNTRQHLHNIDKNRFKLPRDDETTQCSA